MSIINFILINILEIVLQISIYNNNKTKFKSYLNPNKKKFTIFKKI